jgi:macrolide transport system ATP-binding/permease protein
MTRKLQVKTGIHLQLLFSGGVLVMAIILSCRNLSKSYGDLKVLGDVNLDIWINDRVGLVGRNGAGKTTLASIISGDLEFDSGTLTMTRNLRILYVQSDDGTYAGNSDTSCPDQGSSNFLKLASYSGLQKIQHWDLERMGALSGGEQTKFTLAHAFAGQWNLLIMDEPTNNLDAQGIKWLVGELQSYTGAALIISHDRYFLDQTVHRIIEIENAQLHEYQGNYSDYRAEKKLAYENQLHAYQSQQKVRRDIQKNIDQLQNWSATGHRESRTKALQSGRKQGGKEYYRAKAEKKDRAVKSKIKRLQKMELEAVEKPLETLSPNFNFNEAQRRGRRLVEAVAISKSFGPRVLFEKSSFYILNGEKVGLYGANGCGKTTLLKAMMGELPFDQGEVFLSPTAHIAFISQELTDVTGEGAVLDAVPVTSRDKSLLGSLLHNMGFTGNVLSSQLQDLSAGERRKIKIIQAIMHKPNLLVMDEPGNHLDLFSREALEDALVDFNGSILLVSHDFYMLEKVCDHYLVFENQGIRRIEGSLSDYLAGGDSRPFKQAAATEATSLSKEELLLLETRIAYLCSELSRHRPGTPEYANIDLELQQLINQKRTRS